MPPIYAHDPFLILNNGLASVWLDPVMALMTTLCDGWALILVALVWVSFTERRRSAVVWSTMVALLTLTVDGTAVAALKHLAHTPRPLAVFGPQQVHVVLAPLRMNSMPSGHSSAAASLAAFATLRSGPRRGCLMWAFAFLSGLSRVYVGAHWVTDVLVGWILGVAIALFVYEVARRIRAPAPVVAPAR